MCLCVCLCVRLLLLTRYVDFDGNCRKLTVIIRSNYSTYFDVPVRWEVPVRGRKRWRIGDFSDFGDSSDLLARFSCARVVSDYSRAAITLANYSRAAGIIYFSNGYAYLVYEMQIGDVYNKK